MPGTLRHPHRSIWPSGTHHIQTARQHPLCGPARTHRSPGATGIAAARPQRCATLSMVLRCGMRRVQHEWQRTAGMGW